MKKTAGRALRLFSYAPKQHFTALPGWCQTGCVGMGWAPPYCALLRCGVGKIADSKQGNGEIFLPMCCDAYPLEYLLCGAARIVATKIFA
jgi:hypothetical protein